MSLSYENESPKWLNSKDRKLLVTKDLRSKADIVVAKDGSGKYKTISEALKHVPNKSNKRTLIYVKKGIYYENVRVEKTKWNVMIVGDGMTASVVSGRLNVVDGTPTFSSATFGKRFYLVLINFWQILDLTFSSCFSNLVLFVDVWTRWFKSLPD
jgi:pectinesterase